MRVPRKKIALPTLSFMLKDLEPVITEETLVSHYYGHHKSYIKSFNRLIEDGGSREEMVFNYSGHILHSLYWNNLAPFRSSILDGPILDRILSQWGSEQKFYEDLLAKLSSTKGSGWTLLLKNKKGKLFLSSIPNHDATLINGYYPLLVIDAWEHAYYLDYKNDKRTFFENFTYIIDWDKVNERYLR